MRIILYICLLSIVFGGCKKYPEDHKISLRTPLKRLTKHNWKLEKLYINDIDSSMREYGGGATPTYNFKDKIMGLSNEKPESTSKYYLVSQTTYGFPIYGWRFDTNKKESLVFSDGNSGQNQVFRANGNAVWEIVKLTKEELILKTEDNGKIHRVEFIKE